MGAKRYTVGPLTAEQQQLCESCFKMACRMARMAGRLAGKDKPNLHGAHLDDCVSAALEGLIKAAQRFDPGRGTRFSTYAYDWIRAAIRRHFNPDAGSKAERHRRPPRPLELDALPSGFKEITEGVWAVDRGELAEDRAERRELLDIARRCLANEPKLWRVLVWRDGWGMSYREIALKLGVTGERVRAMYEDARAKIWRRLKAKGISVAA